MLTAKRRALLFSAASVRNAYALASRQAVVGQIEVHSCINIYNFRQQIRDRFVSWKSHLRTTIRRVEETVGFVVFPKCFVVFPKCCLRGLSGACRVAVRYEKTPEQARDNRQSAPVQCKDNTFFAKIQIADFRVNISNTPAHAPHRKHLCAHSDTGPRPPSPFWGSQGPSLPFLSPCLQIPPYPATPPPLPPCSPAEACPPVPPPVTPP